MCSIWKPASTYPPMLVSSSQFATVLIITKQLSSHLLLFIDFLLFSKFCDAFAFVRLFLFAKTHHFTLPHFYSCSTINVWSRQALFCAYSLFSFHTIFLFLSQNNRNEIEIFSAACFHCLTINNGIFIILH